jgi:F0F1-type ATP synthase assembly protein I
MAPSSPSIQTYLGMGAVIAATLVAGMALGWLVDSLLHTVPIFILVGLILGIVAAGMYTYRAFRQYMT